MQQEQCVVSSCMLLASHSRGCSRPEGKSSCWRRVPRGMKGCWGRKNMSSARGHSITPLPPVHKPAYMLCSWPEEEEEEEEEADRTKGYCSKGTTLWGCTGSGQGACMCCNLSSAKRS